MKNLVSRLRKLEYQKGSVFILYSYPYGALQEQVDAARRESANRYIADGGDPDLPKTYIGILEFTDIPTTCKWFYVS